MDKNFKLSEGKLSVVELWESIGKIGTHVSQDLAKGNDYDLNIRERQLYSLEVIFHTLKQSHLLMNNAMQGKQIKIKDLFRGGIHGSPLKLGMVGTVISKTEFGLLVQFDGFQYDVMHCEYQFI